MPAVPTFNATALDAICRSLAEAATHERRGPPGPCEDFRAAVNFQLAFCGLAVGKRGRPATVPASPARSASTAGDKFIRVRLKT